MTLQINQNSATHDLIAAYEIEVRLHGRATDSGDPIAANQAARKVIRIVEELERRNALAELMPFLDAHDGWIRLEAASDLRSTAPAKAYETVKSLAASATGFLRISAEVALENWLTEPKA